MNVVDSSGWLEYFAGGRHAHTFEPVLEDIDSLIVPAVSVYEVFKVLLREAGEEAAIQGVAAMQRGRIVDLTVQRALDAAALSLRHALPMADSIIFAAARENPSLQVYADETRPLLQGARLTAWELMQRSVPVTLICDSMAGWVMKEGRVQAVLVGADRIAANGDRANKIGTYSLSVLAKAHGIPFYVAAPSSTFDLTIQSGAEIPIEQRVSTEITHAFGKQTAPDGCRTYNPAFDVAPAENISALITERGVIQPVTKERIQAVLGS